MGSKDKGDILPPYFKIRARKDKTIYSRLQRDRDRSIIDFPDAQVGAVSSLLYCVLVYFFLKQLKLSMVQPQPDSNTTIH